MAHPACEYAHYPLARLAQTWMLSLREMSAEYTPPFPSICAQPSRWLQLASSCCRGLSALLACPTEPPPRLVMCYQYLSALPQSGYPTTCRPCLYTRRLEHGAGLSSTPRAQGEPKEHTLGVTQGTCLGAMPPYKARLQPQASSR